MNYIERFRGLLSFSTIIPVKTRASIEEIASITIHWPLIGALIGLFVGSVGFVTSNLFPMAVVACLSYGAAIWLTGFHHLDGLIDMGDALMAHGSFEDRIKVMRDHRIGTGGLGALLIVSSVTIGAIYSLPAGILFQSLLISEIGAKIGITSCCVISRPLDTGTGRYFILAADKIRSPIAWLLWAVVAYLILGVPGALGVGSAVAGGLFMGSAARRNFRWSTGDVLGASNEFARMTALLGIVFGLALLRLNGVTLWLLKF